VDFSSQEYCKKDNRQGNGKKHKYLASPQSGYPMTHRDEKSTGEKIALQCGSETG
jgi:hypothetical protein